MIVNQPRSITEATIAMLAASIWSFYLTGSRFFGNVKSTSDHDYFVQQNMDVVRLLEENGFTRKPGMDAYLDDQTASVYQHIGANVHIQLVYDADLKNAAQNFIKSNHDLTQLMKRTHKEYRGFVWNVAFQMAEKLVSKTPTPENLWLTTEERQNLCQTTKIRTIASVKNRHKCGLVEAKNFVVEEMRKMGIVATWNYHPPVESQI